MDKKTLTVPEAARRIGRNPETVRRWIREGRLQASKVGTQHVIEERDLTDIAEERAGTVPLPDAWTMTFWGGSMPDWVGIIRRQRQEH
jgi:excisionase family DNA binding protein